MKSIKLISILLMVSLMFPSCQNEIKEFYDNGDIKARYFKKDGKLDGIYKEFYNNNDLKEIHIYDKGEKIDSSIYYYPSPKSEKIKRVEYWSDIYHIQINYADNGKKISEGKILNKNQKLRIGNWNFYNEIGKVDSIVEYVNIKNTSYTNQIWNLDSNGDTLLTRGNYFKISYKDTINLGEVLRIRVELYQPHFSYSSDIEVVLPYSDDDLKDDFSNFYKIKLDTFPSLKNDGIPHPEIPEDVLKHQISEFGLLYEQVGEKRLRGVLVEYIESYQGGIKHRDSLNRVERRLYFDETFYIKDTIPPARARL